MLSQQRQKLILDYLRTHKTAQVQQLSDILGISLSTVRRDLSDMEEIGSVRRVHGGAMLVQDIPESPILQRSDEYIDEKQHIGQAAAQMVNDGETIIITGGTTAEMMLPYLAEKSNLTVVTNALNIAWKLAQYSPINVVVLGGYLRHLEYTLLGHLTIEALKDIHVSKIFHGIYGLDSESGLSGTYIQEVQTDREIINAAEQLIILADSSKFVRTGAVRLVPIEQVSTLITDSGAPTDEIAILKEKGITVVVV
jgi:DeoR/GlpR family transcriptional regulator of sugar metabolism